MWMMALNLTCNYSSHSLYMLLLFSKSGGDSVLIVLLELLLLVNTLFQYAPDEPEKRVVFSLQKEIINTIFHVNIPHMNIPGSARQKYTMVEDNSEKEDDQFERSQRDRREGYIMFKTKEMEDINDDKVNMDDYLTPCNNNQMLNKLPGMRQIVIDETKKGNWNKPYGYSLQNTLKNEEDAFER